MPDIDAQPDPQDIAEVLDEDNYNLREENNEMKTFEEIPDVVDVTSAIGDDDEDEALAVDADEFQESDFDPEKDLEQDDDLSDGPVFDRAGRD